MQVWLMKKMVFALNFFLAALFILCLFYLFKPQPKIEAIVSMDRSFQSDLKTKKPIHKITELFKTKPKSTRSYPKVRMIGFAERGDQRYGIVDYRGKQHLLREGAKFQGFQVVRITEKKVMFSDESEWDYEKIDRKTIMDTVMDWNKILSQVRIIPYAYGKNMHGYILLNVRPESFVEQIGFRSGDIIKSVNGHQILGMGDVASLYEELNETKYVKFDIRRGEKDIQLVYEVIHEKTA